MNARVAGARSHALRSLKSPRMPAPHARARSAIHHATFCPSFDSFLASALHAPRPTPGAQSMQQVAGLLSAQGLSLAGAGERAPGMHPPPPKCV